MSQEVAEKSESTAIKPIPEIKTGDMGLQLRGLDDYWSIACKISKSCFAPKGMEKPESIMIAIQMGAEVGLPIMQSVQSIAVINGRPSLYGDAVKGLVLGSGLCTYFEEFFEEEPYKDDFKAVCILRRKGNAADIRYEFSVADAKMAKLWGKRGKNGQDTPWITHPKRMLLMRARGFACRDGFADVLKGLVSREEAMDTPSEPTDITDETEVTTVSPPSTLDEKTAQMEDEQESKAEKASKHKPTAKNKPKVATKPEPAPPEDMEEFELLMDESAELTTNISQERYASMMNFIDSKASLPQDLSLPDLRTLVLHLKKAQSEQEAPDDDGGDDDGDTVLF